VIEHLNPFNVFSLVREVTGNTIVSRQEVDEKYIYLKFKICHIAQSFAFTNLNFHSTAISAGMVHISILNSIVLIMLKLEVPVSILG